MASALPLLHARLSLAVILFAILLGALGTYQFARHKAISPGFRSGYLLLAGLTTVQSLTGLLELAGGARLHDRLHILYGIFAVAFLPGVLVYVSRGDRTREAAFLTMACWVVLIAFLRGRATAL